MLKLEIPSTEFFNNKTQEFYEIKGRTLTLEHSLVSISKWESITRKSFMEVSKSFTRSDFLLYAKCMTITSNVPDILYEALSNKNINEIVKYIETDQTASWISNQPEKKSKKREVVTSELIYYWMIAYNIPFECEKWHLSRLMMLIRICQVKSDKPKKMSKSEAMKQQRRLNAERRKSMNSKG